MTVQELLNSIGETHNGLPEILKSLSIDQLVDIWEFFDDRFKNEYKTIYMVCRAAKVSTIQTDSHPQNLLSSPKKVKTKTQNSSTRTVIAPSATEADQITLSDAAWSLARNTTINQVRENGLKLDDTKVLAYFKNGEATLESVLTSKKEFSLQEHIGKTSIKTLLDWQTMIVSVIDENSIDYNPNIAAAPTNFLIGHECCTLELNKIIGDNAPYQQWDNTNRLLNALGKIGCVTIFDLFKSPLNIQKCLGAKNQTYASCQKLMDDIRTNIVKYDNFSIIFFHYMKIFECDWNNFRNS